METKTPIQLKVQRLSIHAVLPSFQTAGAAAMDLSSAAAGIIHPGESKVFPTDLAVESPAGYVLLIYSRSGMGFRNGIRLANGTGVIDSDYRGEIKVCLHNDSLSTYRVDPGDRIAQAILVQLPTVEILETDLLSPTPRGARGFGHTGR